MTTMNKWKCPKCNKEVSVRSATQVTHRCPANKNLHTDFVQEPEK